jgi:phosphate transport system permease protein
MVVRATEEGLRAVPGHYRLGPAALGISKGAMLWRILLPSAMPGLRVGLVLGIGRALAETAAVMFTAGGSIRMPQSVMDPVRSLAYHIYILAIEIPGGQNRAYAASLILVLLLLTIHMISNAMMQGYVRKRIYLP